MVGDVAGAWSVVEVFTDPNRKCHTPDAKDQQRPGKHFLKECRIPRLLQPWHHKSHGITHRKKKEWEHQVRRRAAMPGGMLQRGIDIAPATGIIDKDHQGYGRAAKYVQGIKAIFQDAAVWQAR